MNRFQCVLILLLTIMLAGEGVCQSDESELRYERGFVTSIMKDAGVREDTDESSERFNDNHSYANDGQGKESSKEENQDTKLSEQSNTEPVAAERTEPEREVRGERIQRLSVILSTVDNNSAVKEVQTILDLSTANRVKIAAIYLTDLTMCTKLTKETELMVKMSSKRALLLCDTSLPQRYGAVKSGPTWILHLKSGDVILEGFKDPKRYINKRNEFTVPAGVVVPKISEPWDGSDQKDGEPVERSAEASLQKGTQE